MPAQLLPAFLYLLFNAPVDGLDSLALQISVRLAEVLATEETAVCRKRARVRRREDQVAAVRGDERLLLDGETSPEQEHEVLADLREPLDDGVGELLPAYACVACGHVGSHGERCVEEQYALLGPAFQVAVGRGSDAQIVVEFLEDVDERGRRLDADGHGEAEPVRLARIVVGVLPDDDRLHLVYGAEVERRENLGARRVDDVMFRLFLEELVLDLREIRLFELVLQNFYYVLYSTLATVL